MFNICLINAFPRRAEKGESTKNAKELQEHPKKRGVKNREKNA